MEVRNATIEAFLKSFAFSVLLCLYCVLFAVLRARALLKGFDLFELLHFAYNMTLAWFFLVRVRPSVVSMNLTHWVVALVTSFSGFLFARTGSHGRSLLLFTGDALIAVAILSSLAAALTLGRSFDVFPALRRVKTRYAYGIVRHPIYLSALILRVGYILKNPSLYNAALLALVAVLYDRRAKYEEDILSCDNSYVDYLRRVKYRVVPGIY
jgi:protein-S-isoprenylcysteine O-methyltransferase Ste14